MSAQALFKAYSSGKFYAFRNSFNFLYSSRNSLPLVVILSVLSGSTVISFVFKIKLRYRCVARVSRLLLLANLVLFAGSSDRASRRFATISKYALLSCVKSVPVAIFR